MNAATKNTTTNAPKVAVAAGASGKAQAAMPASTTVRIGGPVPSPRALVNDAARAVTWLQATLAAGANLHTDSRAVREGDGFLAYPVDGADNRPHIADAVARGAKAVIVHLDGAPVSGAVAQAAKAVSNAQSADLTADITDDTFGVAALSVPHLDLLAGVIASAWYGEPSTAMTVIGVTGTNGKTSLTQWIAQALSLQGVPTALIGTLGVGRPNKLVPTGFTTPNAAQLQHCLADLRADGAAAVAMEVSSHALHQGRANGTAFDIAVFTNLTQDHLDYHGTPEAYEAAKARLFDWPGLRFAVVNADDAAGRRLLRHMAGTMPALAYGIGLPADTADTKDAPAPYRLYASDVRPSANGGTALTIHAQWSALSSDPAAEPAGAHAALEVATLGEFNISNLLGVLGAILAAHRLRDGRVDASTFTAAIAALSRLEPVAGRMERLGGRPQNDEPLVVIDYAHTPDALEKTLSALRPVVTARGGELIVMFGCGGDRDAGKRPLMGAIAARLADAVVLTSDNPRSEEPASIIAQIATGIAPTAATQAAVAGGHQPALRCIEDRASAILQTIRGARREDVVLLAGKGHEATQDIMGKKRPFSDQDHAQLALAARATHLRGEHE